MNKNSSILLHHIIDAIGSAERIVSGTNFETYLENEEKCLASIRVMEIIGEAASKINKIDPETFSELKLQPTVGMRNVLIHDYAQVDMAIVWKTIQDDLPVIKEKILSSPIFVNP